MVKVTGQVTTAAALARRLGHRFAEPALLDLALRHRSLGGHSNERLEFLGDAVLGAVMAELLYHRYPEADEGDLSRARASLVRRSSLAELARGLALGDHLQLGGGELKTGGAQRASILADAMEAVLGAVYLDAGFAAAQAVIRRLYAQRLAALPQVAELKDAKTRLQELLQGQGCALPEYELLEVTGAGHQQSFQARCRVAGQADTRGRGSSRRQAEQDAARAMLAALQETTDDA